MLCFRKLRREERVLRGRSVEEEEEEEEKEDEEGRMRGGNEGEEGKGSR